MAVFAGALRLRMRVIEVLRVRLWVVDATLWIVIQLVERPLIAQQLTDDVIARLGEYTLAIQHLVGGGRHALQRRPVDVGQLALNHLQRHIPPALTAAVVPGVADGRTEPSVKSSPGC